LGGSEDRRRTPDRRQRVGDRRLGRDRRTRASPPSSDGRDLHESPPSSAPARRRTGVESRSETAWQPVAIEKAQAHEYDDSALVAAAIDAREHARARFSGFRVGAALETNTGEVVTGCNVENATYGLTMCAERVALYKALSDGRDVFTRVAVVADTDQPTPPCGSCRQLLWEFCGDIEVILANLTEVKQRLRLSDLLPLPFDARLLE
jgi:cytidine deaminase